MLNIQGATGEGSSSASRRSRRVPSSSTPAIRSRRKFLRFFPEGFHDETYVDWERGYKWAAHKTWQQQLGREQFRLLLKQGKYAATAARAVRIESRTNLLFSFEKMAIRAAVKSAAGAKAFATGLYEFLYGSGNLQKRFERWVEVVAALPRKQTRVLTWPFVTVFAFIAQPETHVFLKPRVTQIAAREYGFDFQYQSRPSWAVYQSLLELTAQVGRDLRDLHPRDMIDIQSFLGVQGSDEYEE